MTNQTVESLTKNNFINDLDNRQDIIKSLDNLNVEKHSAYFYRSELGFKLVIFGGGSEIFEILASRHSVISKKLPVNIIIYYKDNALLFSNYEALLQIYHRLLAFVEDIHGMSIGEFTYDNFNYIEI